MIPTPRSTRFSSGGVSVSEFLLVVAVIGTLTTVGILATGDEWRRERVNAVAIDLAGWLEGVRRASLKGNTCQVTINGGTLSGGATLATGLQNSTAAGGSGIAIADNCLAGQPLTVPGLFLAGGTYSIAPASSTGFTFTPRGTVNSTTLNAPLTAPIVIRISLSGSSGPMRCVRLSPGLGMVSIGASTSSSGTCPDSSYDSVF